MGQFDHCTLYDGHVQTDLYVRSWSTTLSSSMSSTPKRDGAWFTAWQPSQDTLSMTIRQPSTYAQATTLVTLQKWLADQSQLSLDWTERDLHYRCLVKSAPTQLNYNVVMNDINLTLQLLTNAFISSTSGYTPSSTIESMVLRDLVVGSLDDFRESSSNQNSTSSQESENRNTAKFAMSVNRQWSGWSVDYTRVRNEVVATFTKKNSNGYLTDRTYVVKLTDSMVKQMNSGSNIESILKKNEIAY